MGWRVAVRVLNHRFGAARRLRAILLASSALCVAALPAAAQDATWLNTPGSGDFNNAANWSPATVPGGTASFDTSSVTALSFSATTNLGGMTFNAGASSYTLTNGPTGGFTGQSLQITGAGIAVNGGSATIVNNQDLHFSNSSTAGNATIINDRFMFFENNSSAGNATVINNNFMEVENNSTLGNANFTTSAGAITQFFQSGSAGNATITNNGQLMFFTNSTGGTAAITNGASGSVLFGIGTGPLGDNKISAGSINGGGTFDLGQNELTVGANNLSTNVTGVISGLGGSLVKTGTGTLTLSGANTYTGATTVDGGILNISGSIASSTVTNNNAILQYLNTATAGSASITNNNGGNLGFSNTSTAGSATITNNNGGYLSFYDTSTAASATITNNSGGNLNFYGFSTAGSAGITNAGNLNFFGTAGGATIGNDGTLTFQGAATAGSATINNTGTASLTFNDSSTAGGAIITNAASMYFYNTSNAGSATVTNNGWMQFNDTSTAGSATVTNNNRLYFTANSSAGSATITNNSGGSLYFNNTSTAGSASIANNSVVAFLNASTAGSATITNDNSLYFYSTSTAGSATITNNSGLYFSNTSTAGSASITNNSTIYFFDTTTAGNAAITNGAFGNTDFSFSTGPNNDHKLSAGSLAGDGTFSLGQNQLTVGGNNLSTNVTGVIADGGSGGGTGASLVKTGTGTMTLSGTNTYTGATTVNGGTLAVNGSILASSSVTVNAGGTLGGNGIVGDTTINGGALAPGNSIGLLTVQGNLVLTAASSYMIEVSPANADRVNVTGSATLGGAAVKASFAAGTYVAKQYTILNATGGLGGSTFGSQINTNLPSGFKTSLSYDASNAYLDLALAFIAPPNTGLSANQSGVGNALVNYFNRNGGIPLVYGGLTATGLTQASGETATGSQHIAMGATTQFMGSMTDTFAAGRGGAAAGAIGFADADADTSTARSRAARDAYAMFNNAPLAQGYDPRWSVWASGFGGSQTTDGSAAAGSNTSSSRIGGVAVGVDYRFSPNTIAGFAMAGGGTSFSVTGGGSGRSDLFQAGGFVRHTIGSAYLSGALAYGWQDVTTNRTVMTDQLQARFSPNTFSGRFEAGNRTVTSWLGGLGLTPYGAVQFTAVMLPAYAESTVAGSNAFALSYTSKTVNDTRSELGLRTDKSYAVNDAILTLRGRAAWAHDFNTDRAASATFQALPGASFTVNGAAAARDSALTTASAEVTFISGISLAATFEGEFSQVTRSYAGKGVARYSW
jgi:autotransporter-associated beta strand protein